MVPAAPATAKSNWQLFHTISVIVLGILLLAIFALSLTKSNPASTLVTWWIIMILFALFVFIVGHGITGKLLGALIDEQNKMSLARLQLVVWTIVIISAWLTSALWNISTGKTDPLMIGFPQQIWILLGISTTTLVGTPLVLNPKKNKPHNPNELNQKLLVKAQDQRRIDVVDALKSTGKPTDTIAVANEQAKALDALGLDNIGQLIAKKSPAQANLGDLFQGDEVGNFVELDMGKIQLFFFTLILVLAYAVAIGNMFASIKATDSITMFPALSDSMVALLGISHAGNLTNQGISHSASPAPTPGQ